MAVVLAVSCKLNPITPENPVPEIKVQVQQVLHR
jgi:hypothetical protein